MKKTAKHTISLFDFGNSDYFLQYSVGREPFFEVVDGQRYQNMKCQISGVYFRDLYDKYIKELNLKARKQKK